MNNKQSFSSSGNIVLSDEEKSVLKNKVFEVYKVPIPQRNKSSYFKELSTVIETVVNKHYPKAGNGVCGARFLQDFFCDKPNGKSNRIISIDALYVYAFGRVRQETIIQAEKTDNEFSFTPPKRPRFNNILVPSVWNLYSKAFDKEKGIMCSVLKIYPEHNEINHYRAELLLGNTESEDYSGIVYYDKTCSYLIFNLNTQKGKSRDLRISFFVGTDGNTNISIGHGLYLKKDLECVYEKFIVERVQGGIQQQTFNLGIEDQDYLNIAEEYRYFISLSDSCSVTGIHVTNKKLLKALIKKMAEKTTDSQMKHFAGEYKFFMPGRIGNSYEPIYENNLSIFTDGQVRFYIPYNDVEYAGKAFFRSKDVLQIQIFDRESDSLYLFINVNINNYNRRVIFLPVLACSYSSNDEPISYKGLLATDASIDKHTNVVKEYFKELDYFRLYAYSPRDMEKMKVSWMEEEQIESNY